MTGQRFSPNADPTSTLDNAERDAMNRKLTLKFEKTVKDQARYRRDIEELLQDESGDSRLESYVAITSASGLKIKEELRTDCSNGVRFIVSSMSAPGVAIPAARRPRAGSARRDVHTTARNATTTLDDRDVDHSESDDIDSRKPEADGPPSLAETASRKRFADDALAPETDYGGVKRSRTSPSHDEHDTQMPEQYRAISVEESETETLKRFFRAYDLKHELGAPVPGTPTDSESTYTFSRAMSIVSESAAAPTNGEMDDLY